MNYVVSVVIPTFNRCHFLEIAIESVLAQTFKNFELIVIDDGSTDGTRELIMNKYEGKLTYVWQPNLERSRARNLGLSLSSGKYIAFLDSDDKWHPDKLRFQVSYIESRRKKDENIALVCSSVRLINKDGELISSQIVGRKKNLEKFQLEDYLLGPRIYAPPSNALIFADFVKEVGGFDPELLFVEDWGLLVKLRSKYKFVYIDIPLTFYRIHNKNNQSFPSINKIENHLLALFKLLDEFPKNKINGDKILFAKAKIFEQGAFWYFFYHDWNNGKRLLDEIFKCYPAIINYEEHFYHKIVTMGLENAISQTDSGIPNLINYFNNIYLKNLEIIWPNDKLKNCLIKNQLISVFANHILLEESISKTKKEIIDLFKLSFSYKKNLRNTRTWKVFLQKSFTTLSRK